MRKLLFTLHLYVALIAGVFVVILGVTGAIMAFETELDHLIHAKTSYVVPGAQRRSLEEIGDAVSKAFPGERVGSFLFPAAEDLSYTVAVGRTAVFVNPYTGEILGRREGGIDFLGRVHQLHLRLLIIGNRADPGKKVVSWAGVAMLWLLVSGVYLWWPAKRVSIRGGQRAWFDLHNTVGILSFVFLLMLAATGVMIGFEESTVPFLYKVTGSEAAGQPEIPPVPVGAHAIGVDRAVEIAREAIPGATPFQINVPGAKGAYLVRSRFPEDLTPGGRSRVYVDQYSGKVLFAEGSRTAPAGTRMVILNRAIHTGDIFGVPSKVVASLASLIAVLQLVSGVVMWWRKRARVTRAVYESVER